MSAYICSNKTYENIYSGLQVFYHPSYRNTQRAIGELLDFVTTPFFDIDHNKTAIAELYALNVNAVNQRYHEHIDTVVRPDQLENICRLSQRISIYQFVKSVECLQYQMCEGDIPEKYELYTIVSKLITAACTDIAHTSELYSKANWG